MSLLPDYRPPLNATDPVESCGRGFFNDPRVHFARNALAHAGKNGRWVVAGFIATGVPSPPKAGLGWATAFPE